MFSPLPTRDPRGRALASLAATVLTAVIALAGALVALPAQANAAQHAPQTVVYVEVNSNDFANVADYTLAGGEDPVFGIGIIFAANINYDGSAAYLHLNERVTWTLENAQTQIRPVQARGTKVLLSVLGNHQGAGIANFADYAAADAFAAELEQVVETYGLDGVDFDDEYSEYGRNGTAQPNAWSFVYLVQALRARLGTDKLITFYDIGPASGATEYNGLYAGDYLNFAWNPWYGTWTPPVIKHMSRARLAAAAISLSQTPVSSAAQLAQKTVDQGYGFVVTYNLTATNQENYLSAITTKLVGKRAVYTPGALDTQRPTATLTSPANHGPGPSLAISVDGTDNLGLKWVIANVYDQAGNLVERTGTQFSGELAGTHSVVLALPDGQYVIRYKARDLAGNVSTIGTARYTVDAARSSAAPSPRARAAVSRNP